MEAIINALKFYADKKNWENGQAFNRRWATFAEMDKGDRARKALEEYKEAEC
jgi:hypothetical protein